MNKNRSLLFFPWLLVGYEMVTYLSNDMYLPALPTIMRDLGITQYETQLTLTAWFLGATSMQLILGPLSDRLGRRPILLIGGVFFVISSFVCAVGSYLPVYLIARFIQGSVICSVVVAGYASIHELYDRHHAIRVLALMGSITVLAPALGPLLGSFVLKFADWRWIFGLLVIGSIITLSLLTLWMPETNPAEKRQPFYFGLLLKNYFSILTNRRFMGLTMIICLLMCGFITWIAAGPFIVIDLFQYSVVAYGLFHAVVLGAYILGNRLVKPLMEKLGIDPLIRLGLLIVLAGGILLIVGGFILPHFLWGLIVPLIIYSFGAGLAFASVNRMAIEASDAPMGARMAIFSSMISAFCALGTILVSVFYSNQLAAIAYIIGIMAVLTCLIKTFIPISQPLPA